MDIREIKKLPLLRSKAFTIAHFDELANQEAIRKTKTWDLWFHTLGYVTVVLPYSDFPIHVDFYRRLAEADDEYEILSVYKVDGALRYTRTGPRDPKLLETFVPMALAKTREAVQEVAKSAKAFSRKANLRALTTLVAELTGQETPDPAIVERVRLATERPLDYLEANPNCSQREPSKDFALSALADALPPADLVSRDWRVSAHDVYGGVSALVKRRVGVGLPPSPFRASHRKGTLINLPDDLALMLKVLPKSVALVSFNLPGDCFVYGMVSSAAVSKLPGLVKATRLAITVQRAPSRAN